MLKSQFKNLTLVTSKLISTSLANLVNVQESKIILEQGRAVVDLTVTPLEFALSAGELVAYEPLNSHLTNFTCVALSIDTPP